MKLEYKHIAPYLPYDLKFTVTGSRIDTLIGLSVNHVQFKLEDGSYHELLDVINRVKKRPILRPLDDLSKEIENKGELFVPIDKLIEFIVPIRFKEDYTKSNYKTCCDSVRSDLKSFVYAENKEYGILSLTENLFIMGKLYEWHFDVEGLIKQGLAIDINTLNK